MGFRRSVTARISRPQGVVHDPWFLNINLIAIGVQSNAVIEDEDVG